MKKQYDNTELDRLIRKSISRQDIPSPVLNNSLKVELYSREAAMRKTSPAKKLSLWYLPMTVNLIIFLLLGAAAFVTISNPWLAFLAAGICGYIALAGILLTVIGIRRTNIKDDITVYIQKGDVTA